MKELTLQELKDIEFDILKKFDAFCKENNIKLIEIPYYDFDKIDKGYIEEVIYNEGSRN